MLACVHAVLTVHSLACLVDVLQGLSSKLIYCKQLQHYTVLDVVLNFELLIKTGFKATVLKILDGQILKICLNFMNLPSLNIFETISLYMSKK